MFFLCERLLCVIETSCVCFTKNNIPRARIGATGAYHMVRIMYKGTHFVDRHMCGYVRSAHLVALTFAATHSTLHHIDPGKKQSFAKSVFL